MHSNIKETKQKSNTKIIISRKFHTFKGIIINKKNTIFSQTLWIAFIIDKIFVQEKNGNNKTRIFKLKIQQAFIKQEND